MTDAAATIKPVSDEIIKRNQAYWVGLTEDNIDRYREIAAPNIRHKYPLFDAQGIEAVLDETRKMFRDMKDIRFEMHDYATNGATVYQHWTLQFRHKRMRNRTWKIEGLSTLKHDENGKLVEHVDFYDLLPIFESVPMLGWAVKLIKKSFGY